VADDSCDSLVGELSAGDDPGEVRRLGLLPLEQAASLWVGVLVLLTVYMLAADVLTGFGLAGRRAVRAAGGWRLALPAS